MTRAERLAELRRYCELFSGGPNVEPISWLLSQLARAEKVIEAYQSLDYHGNCDCAGCVAYHTYEAGGSECA